jgi:hypothetical protein
MSLSQRLKAAEYDRRVAAGLPVDHLKGPSTGQTENVQVDVRESATPVIDLTDAPWADVIELGEARAPASTAAPEAERTAEDGADQAVAMGVRVGQRSRLECPHCGGPTQVDLVDTVGHTVSLSCLSCYHMFRVEASA